jgi:predicted flap endonuclease-1-like 5' DNA nuclease
MDEFREYLKRRGKKAHVVEGLVLNVNKFEDYLRTQLGRDLQSARPEDIEAFASWLEAGKKGSASKTVRAIALYYAMTGNKVLRSTASGIRKEAVGESRKAFPLREFRGIDERLNERLESAGIRNVQQMIEAGRTPALRTELSRKTGIPQEVILEYIKLADLSRIEGLKGVRARLYYDAGVDTLDKLAGWDPEELRVMLTNFVARTGFNGIAPLPKEVVNTINRAREIERFVEFE